MKLHYCFFLFVLLLVSCKKSNKELLITNYESKNYLGLTLKVNKLEKAENFTGADSLKYYLQLYRSEVGLDPKTIEDWTPDSMIAHYQKVTASFRTAIGAFKYTASSSKEKSKIQLYTDYLIRYQKDLARDSSRLVKMESLAAMKDSVLAVNYNATITLTKGSSTQEINKTYVFSMDNTKLLGSFNIGK